MEKLIPFVSGDVNISFESAKQALSNDLFRYPVVSYPRTFRTQMQIVPFLDYFVPKPLVDSYLRQQS